MGENWIEITYLRVKIPPFTPKKMEAEICHKKIKKWPLDSACSVHVRLCVTAWVDACLQMDSKLRSEYLQYTVCPLIPEGFQHGWPPTVTMGATSRQLLSHDTDTGAREGAKVDIVKNQCFVCFWDTCHWNSKDRVNWWSAIQTESEAKKKWNGKCERQTPLLAYVPWSFIVMGLNRIN